MDTVSEMNITTAPHCQRTTTNASEKKADAFFNESIYDAEAASFSKQQLTDHMAYQDGMEVERRGTLTDMELGGFYQKYLDLCSICCIFLYWTCGSFLLRICCGRSKLLRSNCICICLSDVCRHVCTLCNVQRL